MKSKLPAEMTVTKEKAKSAWNDDVPLGRSRATSSNSELGDASSPTGIGETSDHLSTHTLPVAPLKEERQSGIGGSMLDGLMLLPVISSVGELLYLRICFDNAPGLEIRLAGAAVSELRDGLNAILERIVCE